MGTEQNTVKGVSSAVLRAMPVVGNTEFLPSIWHRGVRCWADKDLYIFNQLFHGTDLKSFPPPIQRPGQVLPNETYHDTQRKRDDQ